MSNIKSSDLIFERWKASLRSRDRTMKAVSGNFDELFEELKKDGTSFEDAHDLLGQAIKAHLPTRSVVKGTHEKLKINPKYVKSESELADEWKQSINDAATESFFDFFEKKKNDDDDDGEPKVYGNMSAKEYRAQRRYAEQFPILDTRERERKLREHVYNPSKQDLLNVLGESDDGETN